MAKLLASGFDAVSTNCAQSALDDPTIKDIANGNADAYTLTPAGQPQGARNRLRSDAPIDT